jgi:hypothetical protein
LGVRSVLSWTLSRRILDTASTTAYHHPAADGRVEVPVGLLDFESSTGA